MDLRTCQGRVPVGRLRWTASTARLTALFILAILCAIRFPIKPLHTAGFAAQSTAPEVYLLQEPDGQPRALHVQQTMQVTGTLKTPTPEGKPIVLSMKAAVVHDFLERRLSGSGRDARALRAARLYHQARTTTRVGKSVQEKKLASRQDLSAQPLIVAQGSVTGLIFWSPEVLLKQSELEVLSLPGDILALRGFLPAEKVMRGQKWSPPVWAVLLLTGIDAVAECDVTCRLESVEKETATVRFEGTVKGAREGAPTEIHLRGDYRFHLSQQRFVSAGLEQREKSEAGPVSPALDVKAVVSVQCRPAENVGPLTTERLSNLPLDPQPAQLKTLFPFTSEASFTVDRRWHVVYHRAGFAILRLLDDGNLIAQVNIKSLPPAEAGQHITEEQFQNDIRRDLGPRLTSILKAERIRRRSEKPGEDLYRYRVLATGKANGVEMLWIYYLCAAPDGRQVSLVFAVEKKLQQQVGDRDLEFVLSLRFAPEPRTTR